MTVGNSAGSSSATVPMQALLPGFLTSSNYLLAVRATDSVILNGTGAAVPGFTTAGTYTTTNLPSVTIGGTAAVVSCSGLIGAGLYQINLTVPDALAAGEYAVAVTQDGVSSPLTAKLKIAAN